MRKSQKDIPGRSGFAIAGELKRSRGLPVGELAERLGMSYMGVKAQCLALEKSGHLDSRNVHRGAGRPLLVYRLSARGQELFRSADNRLALSLLDEAKSLFGTAAAEKLLFLHFQKRGAAYTEKTSGETGLDGKLRALAGAREPEGTMPRVEGEALVESHSPLEDVFKAYPAAEAMEEAAVSKALGEKFSRKTEAVGDHYEIRFEAFGCRLARP